MISTGWGSATGATADVLWPGKGRTVEPSMVERNDISLLQGLIQNVMVAKWGLIPREFTHTWRKPSNCRASVMFAERFQAKARPGLDPGWMPVHVKKTRQNKRIGHAKRILSFLQRLRS